MIRKITFTGETVTAADDGAIFAAMLTDGVLNAGVSCASGKANVTAGYFIVGGRLCAVTATESLTLDTSKAVNRVYATVNVSSGTVTVAIDSATSVSAFAALTKGNINGGSDSNYSAALAYIYISSGSVTSVETVKATHNVESVASAQTANTANSATTAGKADALNVTAAVGSATKPIYINASGKAVACTYTVAANVPSNAKFTDTTYSGATASAAGLMSAADKAKLDGIEAGANATTLPGLATTSNPGLMSADDKTKLNGIATGANNYSLPPASATVLGGVKMSYGTGDPPSSGVAGQIYLKIIG